MIRERQSSYIKILCPNRSIKLSLRDVSIIECNRDTARLVSISHQVPFPNVNSWRHCAASRDSFWRLASMLAARNDDLDTSKCALNFIRSATMAADLEQFQQLLNTLLSTDNDARTQAEVRRTSGNLAAARRRRRSRRQVREHATCAAAHSAPRARCRWCVVRDSRVGCLDVEAPAIPGASVSSAGPRRADPEAIIPRGGCPRNFDALTSVSARAIGREIQNGCLACG